MQILPDAGSGATEAIAMIEPARRTGSGQGSDAVRRLIARPIRTRVAQGRETRPVTPPIQAEPPAPQSAAVANAAADPDRNDAELMILKAVLKSERRENANLRARLGLDTADETLSDEARAMRDRWAALVDKLLHEPR